MIGIDNSMTLLNIAKQKNAKKWNYIFGNFNNLWKFFKQNSFDKAYSLFSSIGTWTKKDDDYFFKWVSYILKKWWLFLLEYENFVYTLQFDFIK